MGCAPVNGRLGAGRNARDHGSKYPTCLLFMKIREQVEHYSPLRVERIVALAIMKNLGD